MKIISLVIGLVFVVSQNVLAISVTHHYVDSENKMRMEIDRNLADWSVSFVRVGSQPFGYYLDGEDMYDSSETCTENMFSQKGRCFSSERVTKNPINFTKIHLFFPDMLQSTVDVHVGFEMQDSGVRMNRKFYRVDTSEDAIELTGTYF